MREEKGSLLGVSEWLSTFPTAPPFSAGSETWKAGDGVKEAGPMDWRSHSHWLLSVETFLRKWDVNQRKWESFQAHCLEIFILSTVCRILKLFNKIEEDTKKTVLKNRV